MSNNKFPKFNGSSMFAGARASVFMESEGSKYRAAGACVGDMDSLIAVEQQVGTYDEAFTVLTERTARLAFLAGLSDDKDLDIWEGR